MDSIQPCNTARMGNNDAGGQTRIQEILPHGVLIPIDTHYDDHITGLLVLDKAGFPDNNQASLLDLNNDQLSTGLAGLTVHYQLKDPNTQKGYINTLLKLAEAIDQSHTLTRRHAIRTSTCAYLLSKKMGQPPHETSQVMMAGRLHDVGKVMIPKSILTKPSRLCESEWRLIKCHPTYGAMLLKPSPQLEKVIAMVQAHHERFDGSGYPDGLERDNIPLGARILSVADSYATMTDGRVYQRPLSISEAAQELIRCSGTQFDPHVVSAMLDLVSGYVRDTR